MKSVAWDGDRAVNQPWGCTTVTAEPWYPADGCYFHCGIDIDFSLGEQIRAARPGYVLAVGQGFLVMQNGSEADWYLHCSRYVVVRGQNVAQGQLIGYAGDVAPPGGASFGVHLHYERQSTLALYCNIPATSLDPVPVLAPAFSGGSGTITIPRRNMTTFATATSLHLFVRGVQKDASGQITARPLCHRRYEIAAKSWAAWQVLGGNLGSDRIAAGVDQSGRLHVVVNGSSDDGLHLWEVVSDNDGANWLPVPNQTGNLFFDLQGVGDAIAVLGAGSTLDVLSAIGAIPSGTASPVDLSGLTQVVSDAKAAAADAKTAAGHADVAAQSAADSAARIETALQALSKHLGIGSP